MAARFEIDARRLSTRLVGSFVGLIVLTMLAIGIPTLHLIEQELVHQVQARLEQGSSTTRVLYTAQLHEMQALATLSAERPTLQQLLREQEAGTLLPYLETLRATAEIDLLVVLDERGRLVGHAPPLLAETALAELPRHFPSQPGAVVQAVSLSGAPLLAIVAHAPVLDERGMMLGTVLALLRLDQPFLASLNRETGLMQSLVLDGTQTVTTLPALPAPLDVLGNTPQEIQGEPFYLRRVPLEEPGGSVVALLALPARDILEARTRLLLILALSTTGVTGLATLLASLLAHHITAPLQKLVRASEGVGRGDLTTPIPVSESITEVTALAQTLEQMRCRLQNAYEALHQAKHWHENLLASLTEGVMTVDAAGRLTSFSPGAERILGWQARDVIGRPYESVFQEAPVEILGEGSALRTAPGTVTRQNVLTRHGEAVTLRVTSGAATMRDSGQWEQAYVFRNVTEEERALRLREFLLANVSHEFKTPLAALHAAIELLASELPTLSHAELEELVHSVWQGTRRLEELVDNLLSSASLHTGHFIVRPRPTDLEVVIEEVLLSMQPLLALKGQCLKVDAPSPLPQVEADARRLNQVLINLISNASKFGPSDTPILLRVEEQTECMLVQVSDRGPGIAPEFHPLLFQPFSRQEEGGRSGIGLGLSIVKAIVERHGGSVGLHSVVGQGATFWFTLPIRATRPEREEHLEDSSGR